MNETQQYIDELNVTDEHVAIEAKRCTDKIDRSVLETVCSFSNEPGLGGGVIILGLDETYNPSSPYTVIGVKDSDKLQRDLTSQCANMFNHPVRPIVKLDVIDGKKVLVVVVSELEPRHKPLYFKNEGLPRGAWRRIGSTDQRCTEEDLTVFYSDADGFDRAIAEDTDLNDIDENAVRYYRKLRENANPDAEELKYSDIDLLRSLKAIVKDKKDKWRLTNAGLLVFGKQMALRREMPAVRVDYIRVSGTEWVPDPRKRFESIDMRGPFLLLIGRAFNAIADDLPRGFSLNPGDLQAKRPLSVPEDALREAIVNSLIHQSLRTHRPIQIIRYSNRIEIINPGFSLKPEDTLGEPGSEMRNPTICSIIHETQIAEAKGTGIGTMRRLMKEANMMPPTFDSDHSRNQFTTRILLHHLLSREDVKVLSDLDYELTDNQKTALIFLREVGAVDNITYRQLTGLSAREATSEIKQIESYDLIKMHGQGRRAYYTPTEKLLKLLSKCSTMEDKYLTMEGKAAGLENNVPNSTSNIPTFESNIPSSVSNLPTLKSKIPSSDSNLPSSLEHLKSILPAEILQTIDNLGKKSNKKTFRQLIVDICRHTPVNSSELSLLLKRHEKYIRQHFLSDMISKKELFYTIPEMVNHPQQKYTAIPKQPSNTDGINQ